MPNLQTTLSVAQTVAQKTDAAVQNSLGTVSGISGTVSGAASAVTSGLNAFATQIAKNVQSVGNFSVPSLSGAAAQLTEALVPTSIYRGVPKGVPFATEIQPQNMKRDESEKLIFFPNDLGQHFVSFEFTKFAQNSPLEAQIKLDPVCIHLPLSPNLTENYTANYKTENLNVLGGLANTVVQDFFSNNKGRDMSALEIGKGLSESMKKIQTEQAKAAGASLLAQATTAAVPGVGAALSYALGASINPQMAMLFDNINFRGHTFTFKLFPKNKTESDKIKKIVRIMRQRMLPPIIKQYFYGFPDKVKITMHPSSPYPILDCVLESMTVDYAPNGPAFYGGGLGNPVQVNLQLNFKEIELFNRDVAMRNI